MPAPLHGFAESNSVIQYQKLMETEKITINNKLSMQQQMIEEIENEKAILKGEQTENAAVKTQ